VDARGVQRDGDGLSLEGADGVAVEVDRDGRAALCAGGQVSEVGGHRTLTVAGRPARVRPMI
jgi:hypothetical protein